MSAAKVRQRRASCRFGTAGRCLAHSGDAAHNAHSDLAQWPNCRGLPTRRAASCRRFPWDWRNRGFHAGAPEDRRDRYSTTGNPANECPICTIRTPAWDAAGRHNPQIAGRGSVTARAPPWRYSAVARARTRRADRPRLGTGQLARIAEYLRLLDFFGALRRRADDPVMFAAGMASRSCRRLGLHCSQRDQTHSQRKRPSRSSWLR